MPAESFVCMFQFCRQCIRLFAEAVVLILDMCFHAFGLALFAMSSFMFGDAMAKH